MTIATVGALQAARAALLKELAAVEFDELAWLCEAIASAPALADRIPRGLSRTDQRIVGAADHFRRLWRGNLKK